MVSSIFPPIPADTVKAARAVFGISNFYLVVSEQANTLFAGLINEDAGNISQKPVRIMAMLSLITIFQYLETLPDPQVPDALRRRVEWKYALHLPLNYPGLEAASLCDFRKWLLSNRAHEQNFQKLYTRLLEATRLADEHRSSLETGQVVISVCSFSRLAKIYASVSQALEGLATRRTDWLRTASLPHWYERYGHHSRYLNLRAGAREQAAFVQAIGADGEYLLEAISRSGDPSLANIPEVLALRQVWQEQFEKVGGETSWRKSACAHCPLGSYQRPLTKQLQYGE